jgi:hypothetical protein
MEARRLELKVLRASRKLKLSERPKQVARVYVADGTLSRSNSQSLAMHVLHDLCRGKR